MKSFCKPSVRKPWRGSVEASRAISTRPRSGWPRLLGPPRLRRACRDTLEALLAVHAYGQVLVWKQLALALACAELWLGSWAAASSLASSLPAPVRRDLAVGS